MKKVSFILLLSLFFVSYNMEAQKTKAILTFNDGTKLEGLGKLKGSERVKFRKDKNTKAKKYHFKDLESVNIYEGSEKTTYVYLYVKEKNDYKVLQEIIIGELSLYITITHVQHVNMGFGGPGVGASFTTKDYYLKRKVEKKANQLGPRGLFLKNFKKYASIYFNDCPKLSEKIKIKEFRRRDIVEIVEYYNNNCTKK
jgi:hypothetical protein